MRAAGRPARRRVVGVGEWPQWLRIVITTRRLSAPSCCGRWSLIATGSARWCWSICRCSAGRLGWCGASSAGAARRVAGVDRAGPADRLDALCDDDPRGAVGDAAGRPSRPLRRRGRRRLQLDWHTVMDAVALFGTAVDRRPRPLRRRVGASGLDETLFARDGPFRRQLWSTQIVDVAAGSSSTSLPGVTPRGRAPGSPPGPRRGGPGSAGRPWTCRRPTSRCSTRCSPTPCRSPTRSTSCGSPTRRWTSADAGCRTRRSATAAASPTRSTAAAAVSSWPRERLPVDGHERLLGLLAAGDPKREVWLTWNAKEVVRQIYDHTDPRSLWRGSTRSSATSPTARCRSRCAASAARSPVAHQIVAWHRSHVSNGPTEAVNNLVKRVKRVAFGFRRFDHYRIRSLLYAGKTQLDPTRHPHPTLKREAPRMPDPGRVSRPSAGVDAPTWMRAWKT